MSAYYELAFLIRPTVTEDGVRAAFASLGIAEGVDFAQDPPFPLLDGRLTHIAFYTHEHFCSFHLCQDGLPPGRTLIDGIQREQAAEVVRAAFAALPEILLAAEHAEPMDFLMGDLPADLESELAHAYLNDCAGVFLRPEQTFGCAAAPIAPDLLHSTVWVDELSAEVTSADNTPPAAWWRPRVGEAAAFLLLAACFVLFEWLLPPTGLPALFIGVAVGVLAFFAVLPTAAQTGRIFRLILRQAAISAVGSAVFCALHRFDVIASPAAILAGVCQYALLVLLVCFVIAVACMAVLRRQTNRKK